MRKKIFSILVLVILLFVLGLGTYWLVFIRAKIWFSTTNQKGYKVTGVEVKPAPVIKMTADLIWEDVYIGDPVRVRVRLSSPRAMQEAHRAALKIEQGKSQTAPTFVPPQISSSQWPSRVLFHLFKIRPDGLREAVLANIDWKTFLATSKRTLAPSDIRLGVRSLVQEWIVSPDVFRQLDEGQYVLEIAWVGKDIVDGTLLDTEGKLKAAALAFDIMSPTNDVQRAAHAERLAYYEFQQGKYKEAREHGREALRLDPSSFSPQRVYTYLFIAGASIALGDTTAAEATYRDLLKRLPPPERDDLALVVTEVLESLRQQK